MENFSVNSRLTHSQLIVIKNYNIYVILVRLSLFQYRIILRKLNLMLAIENTTIQLDWLLLLVRGFCRCFSHVFYVRFRHTLTIILSRRRVDDAWRRLVSTGESSVANAITINLRRELCIAIFYFFLFFCSVYTRHTLVEKWPIRFGSARRHGGKSENFEIYCVLCFVFVVLRRNKKNLHHIFFPSSTSHIAQWSHVYLDDIACLCQTDLII